jgi:hypothetical protein
MQENFCFNFDQKLGSYETAAVAMASLELRLGLIFGQAKAKKQTNLGG